jgi:anaerobic C4-dicarboxylate transporter DcuA
MTAGIVALISIAGLGWLGSSFFEGNRQLIIHSISGVIQEHPWVFAVGLFALSVLLASQAATVVTLMPVGIALGLGAPVLIAVFPAVNGYFFLPTYATLLAAISFDQTGTTRIGKYVLNHSFMIPGMVATVSSVVIAYLIGKIVFWVTLDMPSFRSSPTSLVSAWLLRVKPRVDASKPPLPVIFRSSSQRLPAIA